MLRRLNYSGLRIMWRDKRAVAAAIGMAAINAIAANMWIAAMPMAAATARLSRHMIRNPE